MNKSKVVKLIFILILIVIIIILSFIMEEKNNTLEVNSEIISNKKIEWGIKRNKNHEQPDCRKSK